VMMHCDICGQRYPTLGQYIAEPWFICLHCFDKADLIASEHDRWPTADDFLYLSRLAATPGGWRQ